MANIAQFGVGVHGNVLWPLQPFTFYAQSVPASLNDMERELEEFLFTEFVEAYPDLLWVDVTFTVIGPTRRLADTHSSEWDRSLNEVLVLTAQAELTFQEGSTPASIAQANTRLAQALADRGCVEEKLRSVAPTISITRIMPGGAASMEGKQNANSIRIIYVPEDYNHRPLDLDEGDPHIQTWRDMFFDYHGTYTAFLS